MIKNVMNAITAALITALFSYITQLVTGISFKPFEYALLYVVFQILFTLTDIRKELE